jgi:hypothetical protein
MPRKDTQLNKGIFSILFQQLTLNKQGYGEEKGEKSVLSEWKDSYETGLCPFLQEKALVQEGRVERRGCE